MAIIDDIEAAVPALHRFARSLVPHRHDAEDLVQECLMRALDHLPAEGAEVTVLPWLFTILRNLSVSRWRGLRRRGPVIDPADAGLSVPPAQDWSLVHRDLVRGFESLSAEHRQVLLLVSVEGLEYRETADVLGLPIGTVMSRLSRARDALRAHMAGTSTNRKPLLRQVK